MAKDLSQKYKDVNFYFFDSQLNEVDNWNFEHIPDLLYLNLKKDIKNYNGIMTKEHLAAFIE